MSDFEGNDTGDRLIAQRARPAQDIFDEIDSAPLPAVPPPVRPPSSSRRTFEENYLWRSWFVNNTRPADILNLFTRADGHEIRNRNYYKERRKELRKAYGESPTQIQYNGMLIRRNEVVPETIARKFIAWLERMGGRRPHGPVGGLLPVTDGVYGQGFEGYRFCLSKRTTGSGASQSIEAPKEAPKEANTVSEKPLTPIPGPVQPLSNNDMERALKAVNGRRVARPVPEPSILAEVSSDDEPVVDLPAVPRVQSVLVPVISANTIPESPREHAVTPAVIPPPVQPLAKNKSTLERVTKKRRLYGEEKPEARSAASKKKTPAEASPRNQEPNRARTRRRQQELEAAQEVASLASTPDATQVGPTDVHKAQDVAQASSVFIEQETHNGRRLSQDTRQETHELVTQQEAQHEHMPVCKPVAVVVTEKLFPGPVQIPSPEAVLEAVPSVVQEPMQRPQNPDPPQEIVHQPIEVPREITVQGPVQNSTQQGYHPTAQPEPNKVETDAIIHETTVSSPEIAPDIVVEGVPIFTHEEEFRQILHYAHTQFGPNGQDHPLVREALRDLKNSAPGVNFSHKLHL